MTDYVQVRRAREDEWEAVGDLCVTAYAAAGQLEPGSPYEATLRDARHRAADAIVLVAERENGELRAALLGAGASEVEIAPLPLEEILIALLREEGRAAAWQCAHRTPIRRRGEVAPRSPADAYPQQQITEVVRANTSLPVSAWLASFGTPIGGVVWSALVKLQRQRQRKKS